MTAHTKQPDIVLVLDSRNQEHYINLNHIVEVHYSQAGDEARANVVTVATSSGTGAGHAAPYAIMVVGESALALRRQLRRRADLLEDTELPEPAPAPPLGQPTQRPPAFLRMR